MSKNDKAAASDPKLFEVTLAKPHTHEDRPREAGEKIVVNEHDLAWLTDQKVIDPAATVAL